VEQVVSLHLLAYQARVFEQCRAHTTDDPNENLGSGETGGSYGSRFTLILSEVMYLHGQLHCSLNQGSRSQHHAELHEGELDPATW